ncbi:hypothetical protein [Deinococcus xinjiangensis]
MKQPSWILTVIAMTSTAYAAPLMGQPLNTKNIGLCVQYGCQLTKKQKVTDEYIPYPQTSYTYKVKTLNANLVITTRTKDNMAIEFDIDVPRYPLDAHDEAIFLKLIQQVTGGSYRIEILSRCFQKLEAAGGDSRMPNDDGFAEELMLARDHIGVKCFTKPFGNSQSSGIRIFFGD